MTNTAWGDEATRRSLKYAGHAFAVYIGDELLFEGVTFNHACGALYRNQAFGAEPVHSLFAVQHALREEGRYSVNDLTAVSWALTHGPVEALHLVDTAVGIARCGTSD